LTKRPPQALPHKINSTCIDDARRFPGGTLKPVGRDSAKIQSLTVLEGNEMSFNAPRSDILRGLG